MFGISVSFETSFPHGNVGTRKFFLDLLGCECNRLWLDLRFDPKDRRSHPDSRTAETGHPCRNRCTALPLLFFRIWFLVSSTRHIGDSHRGLFVNRWRRL
jgi:hypothetical protein